MRQASRSRPIPRRRGECRRVGATCVGIGWDHFGRVPCDSIRVWFRAAVSVGQSAVFFPRGRFVYRRFFIILPMLLGIGSLLGGCATTGGESYSSYDASKPQTFLAGADVEQAKSLAMGSAVSKGWKVVDSAGDKLVVRRQISPQTAQSIAGEPVSSAVIEVRSDFFPRQGGVDVLVGAAMVANAGSESQRNIDFTESYRDDLNRSLNSLQRAWADNSTRVASATPPLPTRLEAPGTDVSDTQVSAGSEPVAASGSSTLPGETAAAAVPASVAAASTAAGAAPVEDRYGSTPSPVSHSAAAAPSNPADNMMALNRQREDGVWAYYAEHYAKIRGCQLSDDGAVLQEKTPQFEVHRVYCEDEKTFLVRCNAGTCRGLE